ARVQVHRDEGDVKVFSRQLNDVTAAVPELVESVLALPVRQVLLDGEAIALRPDRTPHMFQTTMRRFGRKLEIETARRELPLESFYFDILHLDGEDLIDRAGSERMRAMDERIPASHVIPRRIAESSADVDAFLAQSLAGGHEGLMMKSVDALYEAGRRGAAWLKLKPSHTLDLVVLAVE